MRKRGALKVVPGTATLLVIVLGACERIPSPAELTGNWSATPESVKLLKGRLSAPSYSLFLKSDGSAEFENIPHNLSGTPPGPLLSGLGTWRVTQSSGRTVVVCTIPSGGRTYGLEFVPLGTSNGPILYQDLTDPDQLERFTYVRRSP